ncbi:hypothetical protein PHSY_001488 [Pseudozyma hubeiensis SY62]|uniref:Uncharacterized protein n=1 Tax=Pseudozyma hubeiensis (strain SY62) TaxID=1305764 RepID=R9P763_PSEHS|nr:hypothetical protein PHSY_001488 [Pseudozyma hubeiensis SY62]GAC93920.1 hypothetical protein PHSY_001488 [Pseudozyma hubeiensis SY62]
MEGHGAAVSLLQVRNESSTLEHAALSTRASKIPLKHRRYVRRSTVRYTQHRMLEREAVPWRKNNSLSLPTVREPTYEEQQTKDALP